MVGLYHTERGAVIGTVREDRVDENGGGGFVEGSVALTDQLRLVLWMCGDFHGYDVVAETLAANSGRGSDGVLDPKAALAWRVHDQLEFHANYGEGFHSNDVRGATIRIDPRTGAAAERMRALVKARGAELGARLELGRFTVALVGYRLSLASELVYSGDGGTTEPNAASRHHGAEVSLFWRPVDWLALDAAGSLTRARFRGVAPGEDRIPNSIGRVVTGGAEIHAGHGLSGSLRVRHFGPAPPVEDGQARSIRRPCSISAPLGIVAP